MKCLNRLKIRVSPVQLRPCPFPLNSDIHCHPVSSPVFQTSYKDTLSVVFLYPYCHVMTDYACKSKAHCLVRYKYSSAVKITLCHKLRLEISSVGGLFSGAIQSIALRGGSKPVVLTDRFCRVRMSTVDTVVVRMIKQPIGDKISTIRRVVQCTEFRPYHGSDILAR